MPEEDTDEDASDVEPVVDGDSNELYTFWKDQYIIQKGGVLGLVDELSKDEKKALIPSTSSKYTPNFINKYTNIN